MVALVGQAMDEGALGLSTGLIYPPCCYADTDELVALCSEVARRDGVFVVHMRSESDHILARARRDDRRRAAQRRARAPLALQDRRARQLAARRARCSTQVRAAQASGVRITADQYPYVAGSTMFGAILPPWAHDGGSEETLARLALARRARAHARGDGAAGAQRLGQLLAVDRARGHRHRRRAVGAAARGDGQDRGRGGAGGRARTPIELAFDLLSSERMGVSMISFSQSEEVVARVMREPYVNVCTDGLLGGRPHPRAYGTYPRILGRYVREQGVLTLEEAVRKMTSQAADAMHLPDRGRIAPGQAGDLVAFDAGQGDRSRDLRRSACRRRRGIEHVVVGGRACRRGRPARPARGRAAPCVLQPERERHLDELFGEIVRLHNSRHAVRAGDGGAHVGLDAAQGGGAHARASAMGASSAPSAAGASRRRSPTRRWRCSPRATARAPKLVRYHLTHELAMCCGGEMEVFVEPLDPGAAARRVRRRTRRARAGAAGAHGRLRADRRRGGGGDGHARALSRRRAHRRQLRPARLEGPAARRRQLRRHRHARSRAGSGAARALRRRASWPTSGSSARGARSRCSSSGCTRAGSTRRGSSGCTRRSGSTSAPRRPRRSPSPSSPS